MKNETDKLSFFFDSIFKQLSKLIESSQMQ